MTEQQPSAVRHRATQTGPTPVHLALMCICCVFVGIIVSAAVNSALSDRKEPTASSPAKSPHDQQPQNVHVTLMRKPNGAYALMVATPQRQGLAILQFQLSRPLEGITGKEPGSLQSLWATYALIDYPVGPPTPLEWELCPPEPAKAPQGEKKPEITEEIKKLIHIEEEIKKPVHIEEEIKVSPPKTITVPPPPGLPPAPPSGLHSRALSTVPALEGING